MLVAIPIELYISVVLLICICLSWKYSLSQSVGYAISLTSAIVSSSC
jgi:hypothetical protein